MGKGQNKRRQRATRARLFVETLEARQLMAVDMNLVADINPEGNTYFNSPFVTVGSNIYFNADDGVSGSELWKSDGTEAGTTLVKNIRPDTNGVQSSNPVGLTNVGGTLFFVANDGVAGNELWKSDGTDAGTTLVSDIRTGSVGSLPQNLINFNGTLLFTAVDSTHGRELWKSDGSAAGTVLLKDVRPGSATSNIQSMTVVGNTVFFTAIDSSHGYELWKTDGTESGTVLVKDIYSGSTNSNPRLLTNANGTLLFTAETAATGRELWKSDGTSSGTTLVKDIYPDSQSSNINSLFYLNGATYFNAYTPANGNELWKTDGTEAGTVLFAEIYPGSGSSSPSNFSAIGTTLIFTAQSPVYGNELYKIDPTNGLSIVRDSYRGSGSSYFNGPFISVANYIYYNSYDYNTGRYSLFQTDGTEIGTHPVTNAPNNPYNLANFNDSLVFVGQDTTYGNELFIHTVRPITTISNVLTDIGGGQSANRITITDAEGHEDRLRVERSGSYIQITDNSRNPYSKLVVTGITGATGNGTRVVKIPLGQIDATGQPLAFDLGDGGDYVGLVTGSNATTNVVPKNGLLLDMGPSDDMVDLLNNTTDNIWDITGYQSGTSYLGSLTKFDFAGTEYLVGGDKYDNFRNLTQFGATGIKTVNGDSVGTGDKLEYFNNATNIRLTNDYFYGSDTINLLNIEKSAITAGGSNNYMDARQYGWPVYLNGGPGNDYIYGGTNADTLLGAAGNDYIDGGAGNDNLIGGNDDDRIYGNIGNDTIDGQSGNDFLDGQGGNDGVYGSYGNDILYGGDGDDTLDCGDGNDYAIGHTGNDLLLGGKGNDILVGGTGVDRLNSASIVGSDAGDDLLIGGTTTYASNESVIRYFMNTWGSTATYTNRVKAIRDTGVNGYKLNASTVQDDNVTDTFFGGTGFDWYFAEITNGAAGKETPDSVTNEVVTDLT